MNYLFQLITGWLTAARTGKGWWSMPVTVIMAAVLVLPFGSAGDPLAFVQFSASGGGEEQAAAEMVADNLSLQVHPTNTPSPEPTATPYPPEFARNSQQTFGLTLAATVLVIIVVGGVLVFMPKKNEL